MTPVLKSLAGCLLAALLLTLTTVGGLGGLEHCAGEGASHHHPSCCLESGHGAQDGHDDDFRGESSPAGFLQDCSCPSDHHHPVVSFQMIPLGRGHQTSPIWVERFVCPSPPDFKLRLQAAGQVPFLHERIPPANPPPHLTCGPMLI